ncbi:FAD-dependent monooxygenase [Pusillimonas sp. NJUB218]|uniref:FAD-dependent monooxygenase n=1 Tax=Pusillimonas sp. NJUB218 TaxID=2023230 RepID=UPI000F4B9EAE|nr:FAD-dependent monooxygenase [Pusillimonas sp. NJUB218]
MKLDCDVMIVGGGPVGLYLAAELGKRGLSAHVFDNKSGTSTHPAANANSARTMEYFRRLGVADEIRSLGLPADHPTDVAYFTRLSTHELARLPLPSAAQVRAGTGYHAFTWPTPEPLHRCSQLYVEPVLRRAAEASGQNRVWYNRTVTQIEQSATYVTVTSVDPGGKEYLGRARYAVGCDGPRSTIRSLLGLSYVGTAGEKRQFMGGRMAAAYFSAPTLSKVINGPPAWQYWTLNNQQRALIISVDGKGKYVINIQLQSHQEPSDFDVGQRIANAVGENIPFELISNTAWTAGFALVSEKFHDRRVFLAGDAAHLFTPTGGLGYNTGIEDAANLAWKLEALVKGYGGPDLAESYEAERRPASHRNTDFARQFADSIGHVRLPANIEEESTAGELSRQAVGNYLFYHATKEFVIPGVQLGTRYENSPIVSTEDGSPPPDTANLYLPCGRPGHRAPHVWFSDGSSLYDHLSQGFTLLALNANESATALTAHCLPQDIKQISIHSEEARDLYGADYVLIRPDLHIAWRGNRLDNDLEVAIKRSLGNNGF